LLSDPFSPVLQGRLTKPRRGVEPPARGRTAVAFGGMTQDDQLHAEIDRVGASYAKAGAARYIQTWLGGSQARLIGPPNEHPRAGWSGAETDALAALGVVADGAGPDAVWQALGQARSKTAQ
jgi:hypothetical protein